MRRAWAVWISIGSGWLDLLEGTRVRFLETVNLSRDERVRNLGIKVISAGSALGADEVERLERYENRISMLLGMLLLLKQGHQSPVDVHMPN